jgi:hypothetical protein
MRIQSARCEPCIGAMDEGSRRARTKVTGAREFSPHGQSLFISDLLSKRGKPPQLIGEHVNLIARAGHIRCEQRVGARPECCR